MAVTILGFVGNCSLMEIFLVDVTFVVTEDMVCSVVVAGWLILGTAIVLYGEACACGDDITE